LSELPKIGHVGWARFKVMGEGVVIGQKHYFRATFFGIMDHFVDSNHTVSTEIESNENF
jgi:hypothetical protein